MRALGAVVVSLSIATSAGISVGGGNAAGATGVARVTLSVTNEPLASVLARIGRAFGVNIGVAGSSTARVTTTLNDATLPDALAAVLGPLGASYKQFGRVVVVNARARPAPGPSPETGVLQPSVSSAAADAELLHRLFPAAKFRVDRGSNSIAVRAAPNDLAAMRSVLGDIDKKSPTLPLGQAIVLRYADPVAVAARLRTLFPGAHISPGPNRTIVASASPDLAAQIKSIVTTIDRPAAGIEPIASDVATVKASNAGDVAAALRHEFPSVRVAALGNDILLSGPSGAVAKAKSLVARTDAPPADQTGIQVYHLNALDAQSVAALLTRTFPSVRVDADKTLNALVVSATPELQQRVKDAIVELDGARVSGPVASGPDVDQPGADHDAIIAPNGTSIEVVPLKAATPATNGAASTTANDIATVVTQSLGTTAPNLRLTVPPNSTDIVLTGPPAEIRLAKNLIAQLDVTQKLVVLDTEILEIDENAARNLGLSLTQPVVSTTYSEYVPTPNPNNPSGSPPPFLGLLRFTRSPLSLGVTLNLLVQKGDARILSNPRIATLSGRTATIRSGDNISILTTSGGSAGTVATTQLQTFQTGVSLDITPIVNAGDYISVNLHPTVNSLSGTQNGIPQISTRDTQTTVGMKAGQTLIIGGLIQDDTNTTDQKIPVLGDIPLIGRIFHNKTYNRDRNELVITVTPHVMAPGEVPTLPNSYTIGALPTPQPLPSAPSDETPAPGLETAPPVLPKGKRPAGGPGHAILTTPPPQPVTPNATPSAFAQANKFTLGQPPPNTFANPNDPAQIFYVSFSPTTLANGTPVSVSAITTSNVTRVELGSRGAIVPLTQGQSGFWQSSFNFNPISLPIGQGRTNLVMTAYKVDGTSVQVQIPVSVGQ